MFQNGALIAESHGQVASWFFFAESAPPKRSSIVDSFDSLSILFIQCLPQNW